MKYNELKKLTPYRITKPSSDGTFLTGEMICVFRNEIMFINGKGSIYPDLCNESVLDFEAYESKDYKEFFEGINHYFSQGAAPLTQADLSRYSKSLATGESVSEVTNRLLRGTSLEGLIENFSKDE